MTKYTYDNTTHRITGIHKSNKKKRIHPKKNFQDITEFLLSEMERFADVAAQQKI
jgi:hypothetical protein